MPDTPVWDFSQPYRNPRFLGRQDEVRKIHSILSTPGNTPPHGLRSITLCGFAEVGKYDIVQCYLATYPKDFQAVFEIRGNEERTEKDFVQYFDIHLAPYFGPRRKFTPKQKIQGLLEWLTHPQMKEKWLIFFSEAQDPTALERYWPKDGNGAVIITTRNPAFKTKPWSTEEPIDVSPLSVSDAALYLRLRSKNDDTWTKRQPCDKCKEKKCPPCRDNECLLNIANYFGGMASAMDKLHYACECWVTEYDLRATNDEINEEKKSGKIRDEEDSHTLKVNEDLLKSWNLGGTKKKSTFSREALRIAAAIGQLFNHKTAGEIFPEHIFFKKERSTKEKLTQKSHDNVLRLQQILHEIGYKPLTKKDYEVGRDALAKESLVVVLGNNELRVPVIVQRVMNYGYLTGRMK